MYKLCLLSSIALVYFPKLSLRSNASEMINFMEYMKNNVECFVTQNSLNCVLTYYFLKITGSNVYGFTMLVGLYITAQNKWVITMVIVVLTNNYWFFPVTRNTITVHCYCKVRCTVVSTYLFCVKDACFFIIVATFPYWSWIIKTHEDHSNLIWFITKEKER